MSDESPEFDPFEAALNGRDLASGCGDDDAAREAFDDAAGLLEWVVASRQTMDASGARIRELELQLALANARIAQLERETMLERPRAIPPERPAASADRVRTMARDRKRRERERKNALKLGRDQAVTVTRDNAVTGVTVTDSPPDLDQDPDQDLDPKLSSSSALPQQIQIKEGEGNARDGHAVTSVTKRDRDRDRDAVTDGEREPWLQLWDIWDTLNGGIGRDQSEPHRRRLETAYLFCERRGRDRNMPAFAIFNEAASRFIRDPKTREKALGLEVLCAQLAALTSAAQLSGTALADNERRDALIRKLKTDLETVQTGMNVVDAVERVQLEKKKAHLKQQLSDMGVAS